MEIRKRQQNSLQDNAVMVVSLAKVLKARGLKLHGSVKKLVDIFKYAYRNLSADDYKKYTESVYFINYGSLKSLGEEKLTEILGIDQDMSVEYEHGIKTAKWVFSFLVANTKRFRGLLVINKELHEQKDGFKYLKFGSIENMLPEELRKIYMDAAKYLHSQGDYLFIRTTDWDFKEFPEEEHEFTALKMSIHCPGLTNPDPKMQEFRIG